MASTIVLVHGAWHGAWCWDEVVRRLASRGRDVVAIDLPGHGDDPGPLADLHGDAARVTSVLDTIDGDVLLVGHSYGGAVVTEAGTHLSVQRIVYVAAFCIDGTESCAFALTDDPEVQRISHDGRPDLGAAMTVGDDGNATLQPELARACFYHDCDPERAAAAVARLDAQRLSSMTQSPAAVAWRDTPSTYVVCTEDQCVHPELQAAMARRCTDSERWPFGHSPFLADPEHVANRLDALAS